MVMKNILYILLLFVSISSMAQKDDFDSGIELYDTSEELVPLEKLLLQLENVVNWEKPCQNYLVECQMFI